MAFVGQLRWDPWNVTHIARHGVTREEVEQVCRGDSVRLQSYLGRIVLVGPTEAGRVIAVVLDPEEGDV